MNIQRCFEKFYKNILLTSAQRKDAKSKYVGVCKKLHSHYYPNKDYDGSTKLLIGSYGKHTHLRPPRDVDVLFIMPGDKFKQYDDNESNGQSQLLQDIKNILSKKYTTTEIIKAWGKIVLIKFSDGTHNIELLPAWENEAVEGTFLIPNTANGGAWDEWDPRSEIKKIKESDAQTGKTKALIRIVKKWTENCSISIKSYEIEDAVVGFFTIYSAESDYSTLVTQFFAYFINVNQNVNRKSHIETAKNRAEKALQLEEDDKLEDAVSEWKKIFGDTFPSLEKSEKSFDQTLVELQESYPSEKEEFLEEPFRLNPGFDFKIDAHVDQNGFRRKSLGEIILNKLLLRKQKSLTFHITKNTVPYPYSIKWKVRNFGEEAQNAGDLRGEITSDRGKEEKIESTKYWGEHYVECYAIKDGVCVAFSRVFVPIGTI